MPGLASQFTTFPGASLMGQTFGNYRIRGIKFNITCWPVNEDFPVCVYTNAGTDASSLIINPTIDKLPEQRWARWKVISAAGAGAKPTRLSVYYSVNRVYGPDAVVKNSANFIGSTGGNAALSSWTTPDVGPVFQYGFFTMSNNPAPADTRIYITYSFKIYVQMFSRIATIS